MTLKKKNYLIISILTALFLLASLLIVRPLLKSIEKQSTESKEQQKKLLEFQTELKNLQTFKNKYQDTKDLQKIKSFFVDPEVPIAFIAFLEDAAQAEKVFLEISSLPAKKEQKQLGPALIFLLKSESSFSNFWNFLDRLEKAPYLIEVQTLNIKKKEGKGQEESLENRVDIYLPLKVYTKELL